MKRKWLVMIPIGIGAIAIVTVVGGTAVMLLWNWLLPPLFGVPLVTFWQAVGLLALCRILFGGLGRPGGSRGRGPMSPEDRDDLKLRLRARWDWDRPAGPGERPPVSP
jgi:hypothetical protein